MFSFPNLLGNLLFSMIGMGAFIYGKKQALWKPMALGALLMGFPYLVTETPYLYGMGFVLTAALFVFRD